MSTYFLANLPRREMFVRLKPRFARMDVDAMEAYLAVLRTAHGWLEDTDRTLQRRSLSQGKLRVLAELHLASGGSLAPHEIASRLGVTRPTVTGLLSGLERSGLIERACSAEDRRCHSVRLSPRGLRLLEPILRDRLARIRALLSPLGRAEKAELVRLLSRVAPRTEGT